MKTEIRGKVYTFPDTDIWRIAERVADRLRVDFYPTTEGNIYLPTSSGEIVGPPENIVAAKKGISKDKWVYYTRDSKTTDLDKGLSRLHNGGEREGILVYRGYSHNNRSYRTMTSIKRLESGKTILTYICPTFDLFVEKFINQYPQGELREKVLGSLKRRAIDLLKEYPWIGDRRPTKEERTDNIIVERFDVTEALEDELAELFMELVDLIS